MSRFHEIFQKHAAISRQLFGADHERGPGAPAAHLVKEAYELMKSPTDIMEMADVFNLLMDTCRRAGYTPDQLLDAVDKKLDILPTRKWGKPDANGVIEHIREETPMEIEEAAMRKAFQTDQKAVRKSEPEPEAASL